MVRELGMEQGPLLFSLREAKRLRNGFGLSAGPTQNTDMTYRDCCYET